MITSIRTATTQNGRLVEVLELFVAGNKLLTSWTRYSLIYLSVFAWRFIEFCCSDFVAREAATVNEPSNVSPERNVDHFGLSSSG